MVSLLDLKRRYSDVPTSAGTIRMWAISVTSFAHLIGAFPLVKKLIDGKVKDGDFTVDALMSLAPDLVSQLIAAGADSAGNAKAIKAAAEATIGDQAALLAGVLEASLPGGAAPFLEAVKKLTEAFSASGMKALDSE